jgi:hypothetical protein
MRRGRKMGSVNKMKDYLYRLIKAQIALKKANKMLKKLEVSLGRRASA